MNNNNNSNDVETQIRRLLKSIEQWGHTSVIRCPSNSIGIYCLLLETREGFTYAIAKKYKYKSKASFPKHIVRRGVDKEYPITIFFPPHDVGDGYVYNPSQVLSEGIENRMDTANSQKIWLDIPLSDGVIYGDYITGRHPLPDAEYNPQNQFFRPD